MYLLKTSVAALSLAAIATAQIPCWETNIGTNLFMADDDYSSQPLGFTFPFAGVNYTDIVICSNGFLWLGATPPAAVPVTSATLYQITTTNFLTQGPRIAPLWNDFDPSANASGTSGVHYTTFPASGTTPPRAVITWNDVYEYQRTTPLSMQITLVEGGDIYVHYDTNMAIVAGGFGTWDHIVGASDGTNVANPVSFSTLPITTMGNPNFHEVIARGTFPLVGRDFHWIANGAGGYIVIERVGCSTGSFLPYGSGCPTPVDFYEQFTAAGTCDLAGFSIQLVPAGNGYTVLPGPMNAFDPNFSNNLNSADDQLFPAMALGFTMPVVGPTGVTMVSTVDVDSNGRTGWGLPGSDFTESVVEFLGQNIAAPAWDDFDPSAGGAVFFDTLPGKAMVTWNQVPQFGNVDSNTFQIQFFPSGNMVMAWQAITDDCIAGFSTGANAPDPGSTDLTASVPFARGGGTPITLGAGAGTRPSIGTTFNLEIGSIPTGTTIGAMILSFTQRNPGTNLAPIGMAGCTQYLNLDASFILPISGSTATYGLAIPNNSAHLGTILYAQGATFSAGFNTLGVIATNGGEIRVGL